MKISEFKAKCLRIVDEVKTTGEPVQITRRGEVIATIQPVRAEPRETPLDTLKRLFPAGSVRVIGPPLDPAESPWDEFGGADKRMEEKFAHIASPVVDPKR